MDFDGDPTGFPGQESFVHKRIFGAAGGFLSGGIPGAVGGFFSQGGGRPSVSSIPNSIVPGRDSSRGSFAPPGGCPPGFFRENGVCVVTGSPGDVSVGGIGPAMAPVQPGGTDGQLPSARSSTTLVCPPGMVLSKDNRCFHSLSKKDRKWNPGRKPLLTGGERNAITRAAAAARKIQRTEKQLQKLGMLKKPTRRSAPRARAGGQMQLLGSSDPGVRVINVE